MEYNVRRRFRYMNYISVKEAAEKWGVTPRVARGYCETGRIPGAFQTGRIWNIPEDTEKPARKPKEKKVPVSLLERLRMEKDARMSGGIYHKVQIELTYNSNHIEGSMLTHEQTRYIFETNTIGIEGPSVNVDDIVETTNHFRCIDYIIDNANRKLTERMIQQLHLLLKSGTSDSRKSLFAVGDYKKLANEVGGKVTALPEEVPEKMALLIADYNKNSEKTLEDVISFHYEFESIHPFQDGNGRVGRLILFKECLRNHIVPFIIEDEIKHFYYRGLSEWKKEKGYLTDTCLSAQDKFKAYLDYFKITY